MKRIFLSILCFTCIFVLTGCGSKKVTCTFLNEETTVGYKIKSEAIATLEKGNVKKYKLNITMIFDEEDLATSSYDILVNDYKETDMKFNKKGKTITGTSTEVFSEKVTKSEFIKGLEGEGYTCK